MTFRRVLVLSTVAALVAAGFLAAPAAKGGDGEGHGGLASLAKKGEDVLAALPWHPDVVRANLGAGRPVALTQIYVMAEDVLAVDDVGKVYCLSRRDLTPKWVSSVRAPLASPPAEGPLHYVFLL